MDRFVVISGCSGGGKSTLLAELARRGHAVVEEPGRRVVEQEVASGGQALPWVDLAAFARRALDMAMKDRAAAMHTPGWVFFDRGLIDAAAALEHASGEAAVERLAALPRYHRRVFLTPPWPAIYQTDEGRRHNLQAAIEEYERLLSLYNTLGYEVVILPRCAVEERTRYLLTVLNA